MKNALILALVACPIIVCASQSYVFEADTNHIELASYPTAITNLPLAADIYQQKTDTYQYRYRVYVSKAQYDAGWAALPMAIKTNAAAAADAYRDNYEKWDPDLIAIIETMREKWNWSEQDMKDKIKEKKPKKK